MQALSQELPGPQELRFATLCRSFNVCVFTCLILFASLSNFIARFVCVSWFSHIYIYIFIYNMCLCVCFPVLVTLSLCFSCIIHVHLVQKIPQTKDCKQTFPVARHPRRSATVSYANSENFQGPTSRNMSSGQTRMLNSLLRSFCQRFLWFCFKVI